MALFWRAWTVKSWCPKWFWNMRRLVIFHLSIWKPFVLFFFIKSRAQFLLNCCEPKYQKSREAVWIKVLCKAWLHDRASCSSAGASRVLTKTVSGDGLRERSQIAGRCLWEIVQFNPFCPGAHPGSFEDLQGKKKIELKKKKGVIMPGAWWDGVVKANGHFQYCWQSWSTYQTHWRPVLRS